MRRRRLPSLDAALPWALAALALLLAFAQRLTDEYTDSRIELTADPQLFLERVAAVWSPTTDLGHVQSGQFVGYLFPMGPWFALCDAVGVPMWIAERLWLALLLWVSAWGAVRLMASFHRPQIGVPHVVAGLVFMCNPYVVVSVNRATVPLLAYAALPWLLLAARRGLRDPRGWRWPAVAAVAIAAGGGGANAALIFWVALAPLALVAYELVVLRVRGRDALAFGWRTAVLVVLASAWWVVPLALQTAHGPDLLALSEQPQTIWSSSSIAEAFRLFGYWISYYAGGFGELDPTSSAVDPYLLSRPVIVGSFLVPLLALAGLILARRWRYAPFFGLLAVAGMLVMALGYPLQKPAARALLELYYEVPALQFLRTTYKAAPLVAIALACLTAVAAEAAMSARAGRMRERPTPLLRWAPAAFAPILVLFALPLFTGRAVERSLAYGEIPASWPAAMDDAARESRPDQRVMVLPGQQFAFFRWGQTVTPLAPALTRRPVLQRAVGRFADARSAQLQDIVDDQIQQRRLVPGQLPPLLELMGVGQVVVAADGRPGQSGEARPTAIADALRRQPGFERADATFGPRRVYTPAAGDTGPRVELPALRRYDTTARATAAVRLHPQDGAAVLDGDADGIAALAAAGRLSPDRALFYAGDLSGEQIADEIRSGAELVFSDSNRRRILNPSSILGSAGPVLTAEDEVEDGRASYDLFGDLGPEAQTVAVRPGYEEVRALSPPVVALGQENRPHAALDGRIRTTWFPPDPRSPCACLELTFERPLPLTAIRVRPRAFGMGATVTLGVKVDDADELQVDVVPQAWNRLPMPGLVRKLRLRASTLVGTYGIDEVEIPGLPPRELLRLPTRLAAIARGHDLARNAISVELQRTTADAPTRTDDSRDAEAGIERLVSLPETRRFSVAGWATPSSSASDAALDRLAGLPAAWRFAASARLEGVPGRRASSAFDGRRDTAWVAPQGGGDTWISWRAPEPVGIDRFRLVRGPEEYTFPEQVDLEADGRTFEDLRVARDGAVRLPRRVQARAFRLEVVDVAAPTGLALTRQVQGLAIAEIEVPGLRPPRRPATGSFATACGELTIRAGGARATARVSGTLEELDAGDPLRVAGCGERAELELREGSTTVSARPGQTMRPDRLSLASEAPRGAAPAAAPGRVVAPGTGENGAREDVRVSVERPAWAVLAESYAPGWRAWCAGADGDERSLGEPRPAAGFANAWRVDAGCRALRFAFAPQAVADVSYGVSLVTAIALLVALLVLALLRRRRAVAVAAAGPAEPVDDTEPDAAVRLAPARAALAAAAVALLAFTIAGLRFGLLAALATLVFARVGLSVRRLVAVALLALVLVPILYVTGGPLLRLGPTSDLTAHWLAGVAVCAVTGACVLQARRLRRR